MIGINEEKDLNLRIKDINLLLNWFMLNNRCDNFMT